MKRIMLVIVSIAVLLQLQLNAGVLCRVSAQAIDNQGYKLAAVNVKGENIQLVQFTLVSDCYVKISVTDHDMTLLADGDMAAGTYNVYYKARDVKAKTSVRCNMEI